ncbi:MAG: hypothetical protein Q8L48_40485 [Archangium sp.]|nr:hypothetical protein [Archangium sp.]
MGSDQREVREQLERTQAALKQEREAARRTSAELEDHLRQAQERERQLHEQLAAAQPAAALERRAELEAQLGAEQAQQERLKQELEQTKAALQRAQNPDAPGAMSEGHWWFLGFSGAVLLALTIASGSGESLCGGVTGALMVLAFIAHKLHWL